MKEAGVQEAGVQESGVQELQEFRSSGVAEKNPGKT
jgi:hypothetical protein